MRSTIIAAPIAEARRPPALLITLRLNIEPKAWFEMGLSYMRMKHDYEAIIAYKAMRDSFLPENRKKWLPDEKKEPKEQYTKDYQNGIAHVLDLPRKRWHAGEVGFEHPRGAGPE